MSGTLLLLLAVAPPPAALGALGPVQDERVIETRFGAVGPLALRRPQGTDAHAPGGVWIQPYSGMPSRTDPRATLLAAKLLGVRRVLNWDSGVAINPLLTRGQTVLVRDYIDFTRHQPHTFFMDRGIHAVSQNPPVCPQMLDALAQGLTAVGAGVHGAVYLGVDGPRRETAAEARLFRQWGADVLGHNLVPEVALAAELELCYAGLVTVEKLSADQQPLLPGGEYRRGMEQVLRALPDAVARLAAAPACPCGTRLRATRSHGLLDDEWWREAGTAHAEGQSHV